MLVSSSQCNTAALHIPVRLSTHGDGAKPRCVWNSAHRNARTNSLFLCIFRTLTPATKCLPGWVKTRRFAEKSRGYHTPSRTERLILNTREKPPFAAALIHQQSCIMEQCCGWQQWETIYSSLNGHVLLSLLPAYQKGCQQVVAAAGACTPVPHNGAVCSQCPHGLVGNDFCMGITGVDIEYLHCSPYTSPGVLGRIAPLLTVWRNNLRIKNTFLALIYFFF